MSASEENPVKRVVISEPVVVSLVIPHFSRVREQNLQGLIEEIKQQSFQGIEILIVHGISPQGRAINLGAQAGHGEILVVMDDDSRMGNPQVITNLVQVLRQDPSVGMAGASVLTPDHANAFQKAAAKEFPRFNMPVVDHVTDSDLPCHGCVAFPRDAFVKVGMERQDILRGLDPDLRVRMRKAAYRVVLVPDAWVYHPLPSSLGKFLRTFIRNGYGSAYLQVFYPEINYDTDEGLDSQNFIPKRSLFYRALRFPVRLLQSLIAFQWIRFMGYTVYLAGYAAGYLRFVWVKSFRLNLLKPGTS